MGKTILIVEDEKDMHDLYSDIFEGTDYNIVRAYDGDEAFEKLQECKPSIIILDIILDLVPGDTFFMYLKSMSNEYSGIPVIIASSLSSHSYRNLKEIDPHLVFLEKPFTRERLLKEIEAKLM
ncbi:MAG TPA: response regulator [Candidatus Brocadiia bacterium]|nr:response regulator [Planctomycetota bacterium]MDO8093253.1 response regulator [Candidatus Brocadiales bacterium]